MNEKWHQDMVRVHYKETDQMKVAHHANYINWFEIGRTEKIRAAGMSYADVEQQGLLLPVLDVNVKYRHPARYDDLLIICTKIKEFSPVRLAFAYDIRRIDDEHFSLKENARTVGKQLAQGSTLHMWLDENWKPTRIDQAAPDLFALIKAHNKSSHL